LVLNIVNHNIKLSSGNDPPKKYGEQLKTIVTDIVKERTDIIIIMIVDCLFRCKVNQKARSLIFMVLWPNKCICYFEVQCTCLQSPPPPSCQNSASYGLSTHFQTLKRVYLETRNFEIVLFGML
jgi:hypothetical protein